MFPVSCARKLALMTVWTAAIGVPLRGAGDEPRGYSIRAEDSPPIESVAAVLDGWRRAEAYAATHPGCEVFVGRGDSMLPLYRDRTVLVVRTVRMQELRAGMTVVFTGDRGNLVAHTLLENTLTGWRTIGVGNREADRTRVRHGNLVGVVVKAYAPALPGSVVAAQ
jgi:hypothetical protein